LQQAILQGLKLLVPICLLNLSLIAYGQDDSSEPKLSDQRISEMCGSCHGKMNIYGISTLVGTPKKVMIRKIKAFQGEQYKLTTMYPALEKLSDEQIESVASYYAQPKNIKSKNKK
jgi:cytochrome c553